MEKPDCFLDIITAVDCLRAELGYARMSHLSSWAERPVRDINSRDDWEILFERLCILWADGFPQTSSRLPF